MNQMFITSLELDELKVLIKESVKDVLNEILLKSNNVPIEDRDKILSRRETASLLKISLPTLYSYTKQGLIKSCRVGKSIRYRLEDIKESLSTISTTKRIK